MAIASQPFRGRPACIHCGFCMGFGCEARAKSSALYTMVPEAEATGRCEVRAQSYVFHVGTNARGLAIGVHYFDADKRQRFKERVPWCCPPTERRRRACCSIPRAMALPKARPIRAAWWVKISCSIKPASAHALFEHELNEYKSVRVTRILHDFYDTDPKRGFYGGGEVSDGRINPQPAVWALSSGGDAVGVPTSRPGSRGSRVPWYRLRSHGVAGDGNQQREHRS